MLKKALKDLIKHRELLQQFTLREIRIRYKQTVLGVLWAILQPLSMMIIFSIVFSKFAKIKTGGIPYPIFYYSALLPWTFFASSVTFGITSIVRNMNLVTKVYFPREIFPLSSIFACFIDFLVASTIFIGMMIFYKVEFSLNLLFFPLLVFIQIIFTCGICFLGSALNVYFRDIRFAVPLGIQLWMFLTPIIYPLEMVPKKYLYIYLLNPMAGLIDSYRRIFLKSQSPNFLYLEEAIIISISLFFISWFLFKRLEKNFADVI